jgi:hypothetical protein
VREYAKLSESIFFYDPFNELLNLYPALVHGLAVQYNNNIVFIGCS